MNIKYLYIIILYLIFILPHAIVGNEDTDSSSSDSSDSDYNEEEDSSSNNQKNDWATREVDTSLNFDGFQTPLKINWSEEQCESRVTIKNLCQYCTDGQSEAWNNVLDLLLEEAERFHDHSPEDFRRLLYKMVMSDRPCLYTKTTGDDNDIKLGESGRCKSRTHEQDDDGYNSIKFTLMAPDDMINEGYINKQLMEDLLSLLDKLPMTGGMDLDDNINRIEHKIIRQVAEMITTCSYHVKGHFSPKDGPVAEWLLRSPSKREEEFLDVEGMMKNIEDNYSDDISQVYEGGEFDGVIYLDTWPTIDSKFREPSFSKISPFLHTRELSLTEYLLRHNIKEGVPVEFIDAHVECPFYKQIEPILKAVKQLMNETPRPDDIKQRLQQEFNKIPKDTYQYPNDQELAKQTKDKLEELFNDPSYDSKLIVLRDAGIKEVKRYYGDWYNANFPGDDTLLIKDKKLERDDNNVAIVEDASGHVLHQTHSCNRVMVTKSHFRMLSPHTRHIVMQNAMRNYLHQTVLYFYIGMANEDDVYRIWKMMSTSLMLLDGPNRSINIRNGEGGSIYDITLNIIPPHARAGQGMFPGQAFLSPAFPYNNNNEVVDGISDETDEFDEVSTATTERNSLPFPAIVALMNYVGKDMFNEILIIMGVDRVKVVKSNRKYYLQFINDDKFYWYHYDYIFGDDYLTSSIDVSREYINNEYRGEWLVKDVWDEDREEWVEAEHDSASNKYILECTYDILEKLYADVDESSDGISLMKKRFKELWASLLELGFDKNDNIMTNLATFKIKGNKDQLETFWNYIHEMNQKFEEQGTLFMDKYYMPHHQDDHNLYKYLSKLRKRNSVSANMMKQAMIGTKFEHLINKKQYNELREELEKKNARERAKKGAHGNAGQSANIYLQNQGNGETVFGSDD